MKLPPLPTTAFAFAAAGPPASLGRRPVWALLLLLAALALAGILAGALAALLPAAMGARPVDAHQIRITGISITSSAPADNEYLAGDVISFEVTFSENVKDWNPGILRIPITVGSETRNAYAEAEPDGGNTDATVAFHYTVRAYDQDTDGITVDENAEMSGAINHTDTGGADHTSTNRALPDSLVAGWTNQAMHKVNANPTDYDTNDNNLIEVNSLAQLNAIRWDLDGDGSVLAEDSNYANYYAAFPKLYTGDCLSTCNGYELMTDLSFDQDGDGVITAAGDPDYWNGGAGWLPIGLGLTSYNGRFDGNGHTLSHLYTNRSAGYLGLFGLLGGASGGSVTALALTEVSITNTRAGFGYVGALAGGTSSPISAVYVSGTITGGDNHDVGGLVGEGFSQIRASYSSAAITTGNSTGPRGSAGGLAGWQSGGTITGSYATGAVSGGSGAEVGGLVGRRNASAAVTDSYWDKGTTGQTSSAGSAASAGKTTAQLQAPAGYTGIYARWNLNLDGETGDDDPWHFGRADEYPALQYQGLAAAPQGRDYDRDDDNLIDIHTIRQLDAVRYDLDADGAPDQTRDRAAYGARYPGAMAGMGCAAACAGYELRADLSFDSNGDNEVTAADNDGLQWNNGQGWNAIGGVYTARFEGNGHTISRLFIKKPFRQSSQGLGYQALFAEIGATGVVSNLGLRWPIVDNRHRWHSAPLAGLNRGRIERSYARGGRVTSARYVEIGGLVADNRGTITASYADNAVNTTSIENRVGGLAGRNSGTIIASYARGNVWAGFGTATLGGLVGLNTGGTITASYARGNVNGWSDGGGYNNGGLVGESNGGSIAYSYATGNLNANNPGAGKPANRIGGLVGYVQNSPTVTASYWNTATSGRATTAGNLGTGQTTAELLTVTGYTGIYADWNANIDGVTGDDDPWHFDDNDYEYPVLKYDGLLNAHQRDYDRDNDNLIEIRTLAQLDALRYDLDGDGAPAGADAGITAYTAVFPAPDGCAGGCVGYELALDLDFDTDDDNDVDASDSGGAYWNGGLGWAPIAASIGSPFGATLRGNGHRIANLYIRRAAGSNYHSLLGVIGGNGRVEGLQLTGVSIQTTSATRFVGGVAGLNRGVISESSVAGSIVAGGSNIAGGIAGQNDGTIAASFNRASVAGSTGAQAGGIAGRNQGTISAVYNTAAVSATSSAQVGGIAGRNQGPIAAGYNTGPVSAGAGGSAGALVGQNAGGTVTGGVWDATASARTSSAGSPDANGITAAQLQGADGYTGQFASWDVNLDGVAGGDNPWNFGLSDEYPVLRYGAAGRLPQGRDYDRNNNNLIDINTLARLDAIRGDRDGNGVGNDYYYGAFAGPVDNMGCPAACAGYELRADLDFDENGDGEITEAGDPTYWNDGKGFRPLSWSNNPYTAKFIGNGHTISNLYINDPTDDHAGLFGWLGRSGRVQGVGLHNARVTGRNSVALLVGYSLGTVSDSYAHGSVTGASFVGGIVGNHDTGASIIASWATAQVTASGANAGGVAGRNRGTIIASYANAGAPGGSGTSGRNGLAGLNDGAGVITDSYHDSDNSGIAGTTARTSAQLATPTDYGTSGTDIYGDWNVDVDGVSGNDNPWDFGTNLQYPVLRRGSFDPAAQRALQYAVLAPTANAGVDQSSYENSVVTLDASASADPQGQTITYAWTQGDGGPRVTLSDATAAAPSFTTPDVGAGVEHTLTFSLTVSDGLMTSAADTMTVFFRDSVDFDDDDDGLIDIRTLAQLHAVRYDLDGNGEVDDNTVQANVDFYAAAFPFHAIGMGCQPTDADGDPQTPATPTCAGYELRANLTFDLDDDGDIDAADYDTDESGTVDSNDADAIYWNDGAGWDPIGGGANNDRYTGDFEGNGLTIARLYINRGGAGAWLGLFAEIGRGAKVVNLGLTDVNVDTRPGTRAGALAGRNHGRIEGSYSTGRVSGGAAPSGATSTMGGLVGTNDAAGTILASYSTAAVTSDEGASNTGQHFAGGLVGLAGGHIGACFAKGRVEGYGGGRFLGGGLVGYLGVGGTIIATYATGTVVSGASVGNNSRIGGLVGQNEQVIGGVQTRMFYSYATGRVINGNSHSTRSKGLVGGRGNGSRTWFNYYDPATTGQSGSDSANIPKTTHDLQDTVGYWDSYHYWNVDVDNADGDGTGTFGLRSGADDPWDFGAPYDYPILKYGGLDKAPQRDYDRDDDNLIDIYSHRRMNAMRYDLDGDGVPAAAGADAYHTTFMAAQPGMGCPDGCAGYELNTDIRMDNYGNPFRNNGRGWQPIGAAAAPYNTVFAGNARQISNLHINRNDAAQLGLFGALGSGGSVTALALKDVSIASSRTAATEVGSVAGRSAGVISAVYVDGGGALTGTANDSVGGIVGRSSGRVTASWSGASVTGGSTGDAGGLIGYHNGGALTASYARGAVSGGSAGSRGGLVGRSAGGGASVTASYWNTADTGQATSAGSAASAGKTAAEMQAPTDYDGIYADWNRNLDGQTGGDDPWHFGFDSEYPILIYQGMYRIPQERDYDRDDDNLIDIYDLAQLNAVRWDRDGNGDPVNKAGYYQAFIGRDADNMGCASSCLGYELRADLDFDENGDGEITATGDPTYWNGGAGFNPISWTNNAYTARFIGNGHTISNLYINRPSNDSHVGLFGWLGGGGRIEGVGLHDANVTGGDSTAIIAGYSKGTVSACYAYGSVTGAAYVGGIAGNHEAGASIIASYATVKITASGANAGGLVGRNRGTITASYANEAAPAGAGTSGRDGLAGLNDTNGAITDSYHDSTLNSAGAAATARTSQQLASPTEYGTTGIYASWNVNTDGQAGNDDPWEFGADQQYPVLQGGSFDTAAQLAAQRAAHAPVANAGENQTTYEEIAVTLDGSASSDPHGQTLTYAWTQGAGGPRVTLSDATAAMPTFTTPSLNLGEMHTLTFTLIVRDGLMYSDPATVTVAFSATVDYDDDDDGLIDIRTLAQLDAIRYDLNGDGAVDAPNTPGATPVPANVTAYEGAFEAALDGMGCPLADHDSDPATDEVPVCAGYELRANLTFDQNGDDQITETGDPDYWNGGAGWDPIGDNSGGRYTSELEGNEHTISRLYINRGGAGSFLGLFAEIGRGGKVANLGLKDVNVDTRPGAYAGALAGRNHGLIEGSHSTGQVSGGTPSSGFATMGGLAGTNDAVGTIIASYSTASVTSDEGTSNRATNHAGGLVGLNGGAIRACFATGRVEGRGEGAFFGGGLVGHHSGLIIASYATGAVANSAYARTLAGVGGLVGRNTRGSYLIGNYAIGRVSTVASSYSGTGGMVGRTADRSAFHWWNVYDQQTTGQSGYSHGTPKTTAHLKGWTYYGPSWETFGNWNVDVDNADGNGHRSLPRLQSGADDPWDFGSNQDYPILKYGGLDKAPQRDHDRDNDNLIDIHYLRQVDAIRYDLDGNGVVDDAANADDYRTVFAGPLAQMGCPDGCTGYELAANQNFDTDNDGSADSGDLFWDDGKGWQPIGAAAAPYAATFAGNGRTLSNLFISRGDTADVGLFGAVGSGGNIYGVALTDASVTGSQTAAGNVGGIAGRSGGAVAASFVTGAVAGSANDSVGGIVGRNASGGTVSAVYNRASVSAGGAGSSGDAGGLVGFNDGGTVTASYARGAVSGGGANSAGGAVGRNGGSGSVTNVYWDTAATGQTASAGSAATAGKTAAQLQEPVGYAGIYAGWDVNLDGADGGDAPWDFGISAEYPALIYEGMQHAPQRDYDRDDDNRIDIGNLARLDAVRYDLDGTGVPTRAGAAAYRAAFPGPVSKMGCAATCAGYELRASLDFDENGDGEITEAGDPAYWNDGAGWEPIGDATNPYASKLIGGGHTVSHLFIARSTADDVGLFGRLSNAGRLEGIGLPDAAVTGQNNVGALAGSSAGAIANGYALGTVSGAAKVGGLVGHNDGGSVTAAYTTATVAASGGGAEAGGLVGHNDDGTITASYANGRVPTGSGGLVGTDDGTLSNRITNSYHDSTVSGITTGDTAKTSLELAGPTAYGAAGTSIYGDWNVDVDESTGNDDPWAFGTDRQYPALRLGSFDTAAQFAAQTAANRPPTAEAGANQSIAAGGVATLDGTGSSDPESQTLTYAWTQTADGPRAVIGDAAADKPTVGAPQVTVLTTLTFALTVDDGINISPPDTVNLTVVGETFDYDGDDNGLIDIRNTAQLDAMRYDLDGDGVVDSRANAAAYAAAFPSPAAGLGCPRTSPAEALPVYACTGYELRASLDFDENDDNVINALDDDFWNGGKGWAPIGSAAAPYAATFRGNGNTIANLYINRAAAGDAGAVGLFGALGGTSSVTTLGLVDASVTTGDGDDRLAGILAGVNSGAVSVAYAQGSVAGGANASAGGLVGRNAGTITAAYALAGVRVGASGKVGGLAGENRNRIAYAYAAGGAVSGGASASAGGLVGVNSGGGQVSNSYWDQETTGQTGSAGSAAAAGKATTDLLSPTGYAGIYSGWNINLNADPADDNPWDFGIANQYPVLRFGGHDAAGQFAIQPDRAPSFGTASASAQGYLVGVLVSETLPAAVSTSGNGAFAYTLTGPGAASTLTLPAGLSYIAPGASDTHGGTISGLPSRAAAAGQYTLTVADADGNTAGGDTASLTFNLTVTAADTAPESFSFTPQSGVAPGTVVTSNTITVSGINTVASIGVTNGSLIVDGSAFSGDSIRNGQTVAVKVTASATLGASVTATVTIGGVSADFVVTTRAAGTDATLSALSVTGAGGSAVALDPAFAASQTSYTATTTADVVTVSATAADGNASAPSISPADSNSVANGHQVATTAMTTTITVSVTAEDGVTTTQYTITVTRANDPPTAEAGANQTVAEGAAVTLSGSGSDPERQPLTYAWRQTSGTPDVTLTNADTATATFTAPTQLVTNAVLVFELTVTDHFGRAVTDTVTITVTAGANDPPTADAGSNFTVGEGAIVTLNGSGTDPENETLSYAWTRTSGTHTVSLTNANTAVASFTAPSGLTNTDATLVFQLTVTDARGASGNASVTVTVTAGNTSPVPSAGADQTVAEGAPVTLAGSATDDKVASQLSYAWAQTSGMPTVTLTNANAAAASFTAPTQLASNAALVFRLTVTDADLATGTDTVTITVTAGPNDAPTANAGSDQTVAEGAAVTLSGSGSDPEDEALSYSWQQTAGTPDVTLTDDNTASASFTAPTQLVSDASLVFELTVTDARNASHTDTVTITVTAGANDAPSVAAGNDRSVSEGQAVTLSGRATDPEQETLSYSWAQTSGTPNVTLTGANTATASFTAPTQLAADAVLVFTLTVTDARNAASTDRVTITVTAGPNDAPTAEAGANRAVAFGDAVTLSGSGTDPENETLSYSWRQTSGSPNVALTGASSATASFTAPTGHTTTIYLVFELTVTDARGASATDTVTITVTAADTTPDSFSLAAVNNVAPSTAVTSNTITVSGIETAVAISVTNGSLLVNGAAFTGATVSNGQRVAVRVTSSSALGQSVTATLTIGSVSRNFVVTTRAARTDATLRALTLSDGGEQTLTLTPAFAAARTAYTATYLGPVTLTVSATANDSSASVRITPADGDSGTSGHQVPLNTVGEHTITIRVTAEDGTTTRDYTITATRQNAAHTAEAGSNQTVAEGAAVTLSGGGNDPDSETLSYQWSQSSGTPNVTLTDAATATASFTAPSQLVSDAVLAFKLTITDPHGLAVSDTVTVTVTAGANDAPTANAGTDQTVNEGDAVTLAGSGSDPENETLSYSWRQTSGTPNVTLSDANIAGPGFTAPAQLVSNASLVFELTVTDARGASDTDTVTITVTAGPNDAPTANAGADRTVGVGDAVTLAGSGSDPENETLSYSWRQTTGTTVTLTGDNTASVSFTAPTTFTGITTDLVFELTVTDARNATGTDTVTVTVSKGAQASVTGPTARVAEGGNAVFTVRVAGVTTQPVTVTYAVAAASSNSAQADDLMGGFVTGETVRVDDGTDQTATITIAVAQDTAPEGAESFTVTLTGASGAAADSVRHDGAPATATIALSDPALDISETTRQVDEGSSGGAPNRYTVALAARPDDDVRVAITSDNTDVSVNPASLTFTDGDWNTAQTVTISAAEDNADTANETAILTHTASDATVGDISGYAGVSATLRVSVTDNEADYDRDDNNLIDVTTLAQLHAIRYDLDGDGVPSDAVNYAAGYPNGVTGMGCPATCAGYELLNDLDFAGTTYASGDGWLPIGDDTSPGARYNANFHGNGHIISNLVIDRNSRDNTGLFGALNAGRRIDSVGVVDARVTAGANVGILVGSSYGTIAASYTTGAATGSGVNVGGLFGSMSGAGARVIASYSTAAVSGAGSVGGLGGDLAGGAVTASYAAGSVSGSGAGIGGLFGARAGSASVTASYWDTDASGQTASAGGSGKTTPELMAPTGYAGIYARWNVAVDGQGGADDPWDFGAENQYPALKIDGFSVNRQRPVVASAGADFTVGPGETATLDGSSQVRISGAAPAYAWAQVAGNPTVTLSDADTAQATFTAPAGLTDAVTLVFELTVTAGGHTGRDRVSVTVEATPPPTPAAPTRSVGRPGLVGLAVRAGGENRPLSPAFTTSQISYAASVDAYTTAAAIIITPADPDAAVVVNGAAPAADSDGIRTMTVSLAEGSNRFRILITPTASSANAATPRPTTVLLTIRRQPVPRLAFEPSRLIVDEGSSTTYTVDLDTRWLGAEVTVTIASDSPAITVSPDTVSFRPTDWSPRTVTVTAALDADSDDDVAGINHRASGGHFNNVTGRLRVEIRDAARPPGPTPTPTPTPGTTPTPTPAPTPMPTPTPPPYPPTVPVTFTTELVRDGHTVTITRQAGALAGVTVALPARLDRSPRIIIAPPPAGTPRTAAGYGLGRDVQAIVSVRAVNAPSDGLEICLPVLPELRAEAGEHPITLVRYDATAAGSSAGWRAVPDARLRGTSRVCAAGITGLPASAAFAAAYIIPTLGVPSDLTVTPGAAPGTLTLSWTPGTQATRHWIAGIKQSDWDAGDFSNAIWTAADSNTMHRLSDLESGAEYVFTVTAGRSIAGVEEWSPWSDYGRATPN